MLSYIVPNLCEMLSPEQDNLSLYCYFIFIVVVIHNSVRISRKKLVSPLFWKLSNLFGNIMVIDSLLLL